MNIHKYYLLSLISAVHMCLCLGMTTGDQTCLSAVDAPLHLRIREHSEDSKSQRTRTAAAIQCVLYGQEATSMKS